MHILQAQSGSIDDGSEPIDLGQTPGDIVVISAADTEIAGLSAAFSELDGFGCTLRLANMMNLRHPMSVDMHLANCATKSKIVIARVLGGKGYWTYGLEQFSIELARVGVLFAALPGDDKPDEELLRLSTIGPDDWHALWQYLVEGGPENTSGFLHYARAIARDDPRPPPARPLLRAGVYWPGAELGSLDEAKAAWTKDAPIAPIIFYRALVQGAGLQPLNRLTRSLLRRGLNPLPIFVASLKDPVSVAILEDLFAAHPPDVILNCTAFSVGTPGNQGAANPLASDLANRAPVFQVVFSGSNADDWESSPAGLSARDIAMNVALPEVDGRVLTRAVSFKGEAYFDEATECPITTYVAQGDRVEFTADLAAKWAALRATPNADKKSAIILANYPNRDGRLANGVGLDTPASAINVLNAMRAAGHDIQNAPQEPSDLMDRLMAGPTNFLSDRHQRDGGQQLSLADYEQHFKTLPLETRTEIIDRWGPPETDPFIESDAFKLSIHKMGNTCVAVQPARGYNIDPKDSYHSPDLVPPHNYLAFYFWLRHAFGADALIHLGKHGNLEWLPGKALALSQACYPEAILGPTPNIYPFIVNDPGEGSQAKRRTSAVIIDHLTPPLTRAETHGALARLEALVDEYYEAASLDQRRADVLRSEIDSHMATSGLDKDVVVEDDADEATKLQRLDDYLCDIKEAQIRDGLHILGEAPTGRLKRDLVKALVRVPRGTGKGDDASFLVAMAKDLNLNFDPLGTEWATPWTGDRPTVLADVSGDNWRTVGDTIERMELLADAMLAGQAHPKLAQTTALLTYANTHVAALVDASGAQETTNLIAALDGQFIPPAPSGAPTRGRLDVLPTGRNFFSVDSRAIPTPTAWALGWKSATMLIDKHLQTYGDWPRAMLVTAWGTANMRTGGDDIAQVLALMGVQPKWDAASNRVTGFEVMPLSVLDRPRVDVTLRVSGFFRDAFPAQMDLVASAAAAVMALDEPDDLNPAAAKARASGATPRVFGSKPGAYGAGLQAMIDEDIWASREDLAEAYLKWGSFAYGGKNEGREARAEMETQLRDLDAIVQNQDNREHDVLDSDDYYQFEGGAAAAVAALKGEDVPIWHNDHSRPETPRIRTLNQEIARVIHSRASNPKWLNGVKRHGYKGAFEIAATVDYLYAFAASARVVENHHFDLLFAAYVEDDATREFMVDNNAPALQEMLTTFSRAIERGLWTPRSNSAHATIEELL